MNHPGDDEIALPLDQARFIMSLLSDLGGKGVPADVEGRTRLSQRQVERALMWLDAMGYIRSHARGPKVEYRITTLGMDAIDLVQEIEGV